MKRNYKLWTGLTLFFLFMLTGICNSSPAQGRIMYRNQLPSQRLYLADHFLSKKMDSFPDYYWNPGVGIVRNYPFAPGSGTRNEMIWNDLFSSNPEIGINWFSPSFSGLEDSLDPLLRGLPGIGGGDDGGPGQGFIEDEVPVSGGYWVLMLFLFFYGLFNRFRLGKNMNLKKNFILLCLFLLPVVANAQTLVFSTSSSGIDGDFDITGNTKATSKTTILMGSEVTFKSFIVNTGTNPTSGLSGKKITVSITGSGMLEKEWRITGITCGGVPGTFSNNGTSYIAEFTLTSELAGKAFLPIELKALPLENSDVNLTRYVKYQLMGGVENQFVIPNRTDFIWSSILLPFNRNLPVGGTEKVGITFTIGSSGGIHYASYIRLKTSLAGISGLDIGKITVYKNTSSDINNPIWGNPVVIRTSGDVYQNGAIERPEYLALGYHCFELGPTVWNSLLGHGYISYDDHIKVEFDALRTGCNEIVIEEILEHGNGTDFYEVAEAKKTITFEGINPKPNLHNDIRFVAPDCNGNGYIYAWFSLYSGSLSPVKNISKFILDFGGQDFEFGDAWIGTEFAWSDWWYMEEVRGSLLGLTKSSGSGTEVIYTLPNISNSTYSAIVRYLKDTETGEEDDRTVLPGLSALDGDGIYNDMNNDQTDGDETYVLLKVAYHLSQKDNADCAGEEDWAGSKHFFDYSGKLDVKMVYDNGCGDVTYDTEGEGYWCDHEMTMPDTKAHLSSNILAENETYTLNLTRTISFYNNWTWLNPANPAFYYDQPDKVTWGWEIEIPVGFEWTGGNITISGAKWIYNESEEDYELDQIANATIFANTVTYLNGSTVAGKRTLFIPSPNVYVGEISIDIPVKFTGKADNGVSFIASSTPGEVFSGTVNNTVRAWIAGKEVTVPQSAACKLSLCAGREGYPVSYKLEREEGFRVDAFDVERRTFGYPKVTSADGYNYNYTYPNRTGMMDYAAAQLVEGGVNYYVASPNDNVNFYTRIIPGDFTSFSGMTVLFSYEESTAFLRYLNETGFKTYTVKVTRAAGGVTTYTLPLVPGAFTSSAGVHKVSVSFLSSQIGNITSFVEGDQIEVSLNCRVLRGKNGDPWDSNYAKQGLFELRNFNVKATAGVENDTRLIDHPFSLLDNSPLTWISSFWGVNMEAHRYDNHLQDKSLKLLGKFSKIISGSKYNEVYYNESRPTIALPASGENFGHITYPGIFKADKVWLTVYRNEENSRIPQYDTTVKEYYELIQETDYTLVQGHGRSEYTFLLSDKIRKIMTEVFYNPNEDEKYNLFHFELEGNGICIENGVSVPYGYGLNYIIYPTSEVPEVENVEIAEDEGDTHIEGNRYSYNITSDIPYINDLTTESVSWNLKIHNELNHPMGWAQSGHLSLPHSYIAVDDPTNSLKSESVRIDVTNYIAYIEAFRNIQWEWKNYTLEQLLEAAKSNSWYYEGVHCNVALEKIKTLTEAGTNLIKPEVIPYGNGYRYVFRLDEIFVEPAKFAPMILVGTINPRVAGATNKAILNVRYGANAGAYPDPWKGFYEGENLLATFAECPSCIQANQDLSFFTRISNFSSSIKVGSGYLRYNGVMRDEAGNLLLEDSPYPANYWIDFDGDGQYDPGKGDILVGTVQMDGDGQPLETETKLTYSKADALSGATGHLGYKADGSGDFTTTPIMINDICGPVTLGLTVANGDEQTTVKDPHVFIRVPNHMELVTTAGANYFDYAGVRYSGTDVVLENLGVDVDGFETYIIRPAKGLLAGGTDIILDRYDPSSGRTEQQIYDSPDKIHFYYQLKADCGYITGTRTHTEGRGTTANGVDKITYPPIQPVIFYETDYTNSKTPDLILDDKAIAVSLPVSGTNLGSLSKYEDSPTVIQHELATDGTFKLNGLFKWNTADPDMADEFIPNTTIYVSVSDFWEVTGYIKLPDELLTPTDPEAVALTAAELQVPFVLQAGTNRYLANLGEKEFQVPFEEAEIVLNIRPKGGDLTLTDCNAHEMELGYGVFKTVECIEGCESIFNKLGVHKYYAKYDNIDLDLSGVTLTVDKGRYYISGTARNNSTTDEYNGAVGLYHDYTLNTLTPDDELLGKTSPITIAAGGTYAFPANTEITILDESLLFNLVFCGEFTCGENIVTLDINNTENEVCENYPKTTGITSTAGYTYSWYLVNGETETLLTAASPHADFTLSNYEIANPQFTYTSSTVPAGQMINLRLKVNNGTTTTDADCPIKVTMLASNWTGAKNSDWNDMANWSNGVPSKCTHIIIKEGVANYPDLTPDMDARCAHIHFEMHSEVAKTNLLDYDHTTIDLRLTPDKWYMLSAPLQKMYSGDYWLAPHGVQKNTGYKSTSDFWRADTEPLNTNYQDVNGYPWYRRHNHTVYMQKYQEANPSFSVTSVLPGHYYGVAKWSEPFNTLDEKLGAAMGFVAGVSKDDNPAKSIVDLSTNNTFRLPRPETQYEYFYRTSRLPSGTFTSVLLREDGESVSIPFRKEAMPAYSLPAMTSYRKGSSYRLVYDEWTVQADGSMTIPISWDNNVGNESQGLKTLIVGNPFMSHLDLSKFFATNSGFEGHYYIWDGSVFDAFDTEGVTTIPGNWSNNVLIAPMQSFILEKTDGTYKYPSLKFTPEMSVTAPSGNSLRSAGENPVLNVEILRDDVRESGAALYVNDQVTESGISTLFGEENTDPAVVFFRENDAAYSILKKQSLREKVEIGILTGKTGALTFRFSGVEKIAGNQILYLEDRLTGTERNLSENPEYSFESLTAGTQGRFFLRMDVQSGIDELNASGIKVYAYKGSITVSSGSDDLIRSIEVYNTIGQLIYSQQDMHTSNHVFKLSNHQNLIVKVKTDNNLRTQKLLIE